MQFEVKLASISWINATPNPIWLAGRAAVLSPDWVPKTYIGLVATANDPPPAQLDDPIAFQADQEFRAFTYCHLGVVVDDRTSAVTRVVSIQQIIDPGWTPPFKVRSYPTAGVGSALDGWQALKSTWSFAYHAGEQSSLSGVITSGRHANTSIAASIPSSETVLANILIKFRAGPVTDNLGVNVVKCPFHVPWVWCETLLTYQPGKKFKLYGRGSLFPTHSWYLESKQVISKAQVADADFPKSPLFPSRIGMASPRLASLTNPFEINYRALALYPVLSVGAPASGAQAPLTVEASRTGSVDTHANTAPGGPVQTYP